MEIISFLLIVISLIIFINKVVKMIYKNSDNFFEIIFFIVISVLCIVSIFHEATKLRDKNVFDGNAEYVETIYISEGDTIKIYHIQPKKIK